MRSACLLLLSVLAAATADQPVHTGKCAATRPTRSGLAKECTVCAGCHQSLPNCSCCQPVYDNTQSCSLYTVRDEYTRSKCGNPQFAYRCDTSGNPPCLAVPGSVEDCKDFGKYLCFASEAECSASCSNSYNCVNNDKCVQAAPGKPAKYPSLAACNASCSTAPLSPCG